MGISLSHITMKQYHKIIRSVLVATLAGAIALQAQKGTPGLNIEDELNLNKDKGRKNTPKPDAKGEDIAEKMRQLRVKTNSMHRRARAKLSCPRSLTDSSRAGKTKCAP